MWLERMMKWCLPIGGGRCEGEISNMACMTHDTIIHVATSQSKYYIHICAIVCHIAWCLSKVVLRAT